MCLLKTCFPNVLSMTIGIQRWTAQSFFLCPRLAYALGLMLTSRAPRSSPAEPLPPGLQQSIYFTEISFHASSSPARLQSLARCELLYHPALSLHLAFSSWCSEVGERTSPFTSWLQVSLSWLPVLLYFFKPFTDLQSPIFCSMWRWCSWYNKNS